MANKKQSVQEWHSTETDELIDLLRNEGYEALKRRLAEIEVDRLKPFQESDRENN